MQRTGRWGLPRLVPGLNQAMSRPSLPPLSAAGLAYERRGAGPTLVLLHGVGESAVGWRPVVSALAERHDVIALDLPGFGGSPALPSDVLPTAAALADSVEHALDALGVELFDVAGYSLGARVALELGSRGRARSVVAIAADGLGTPLERLHQAAALACRRLIAQGLAPWAADVIATDAGRSLAFMPDRVRPWLLPPPDARRLLSDLAAAPGYHRTVAAGMVDVPRLGSVSCPVLLLQGALDPVVAAQAPRLLAALPKAELWWLPGLSHIPISDDPTAVAQLMVGFLASVHRAAESVTYHR
jgi:pimeloyl-ACP methyl ester carboxylesterase